MADQQHLWWPASADQSLHHQLQQQAPNHIQHHQHQNQQQHFVINQQQQSQALNDLNRANSTTSTVATQQLFSYKMASSFPTSGVTVSTSNAPAAYDYRLGMGSMVSRPGDPQGMTAAPGTQWWYATAGQNTLENLQQQNQHHQQQVTQQQNQPQQQQHQTQNIHNVHSTPNTVSTFLPSFFSRNEDFSFVSFSTNQNAFPEASIHKTSKWKFSLNPRASFITIILLLLYTTMFALE